MVATYRSVISKRLYLPVFNKRAKKNNKKNRRFTKQFEQMKHMKIKIQEVTSDVVITGKNEKQYARKIIQLGIRRTQVVFSDKVTPYIYSFTDKAVVQ